MFLALGLGSNLNNREKIINATIIELNKYFHEINLSQFYPNAAVLPPNAPKSWDRKFINVALTCNTKYKPYELLKITQSLEIKFGRSVSDQHWAPRTMDIDILFYGEKIINEPNLIIPHPELHKREFVLRPLCDLCPAHIHPISKKNILELLMSLKYKN